MSMIRSGNKAHDDACAIAEGVRQSVVVAGASAATIKASEIAFYRSLVASAKLNGLQHGQFTSALMELGTGGT
jgi:ferritin-like metal-binding protein YciE